MRLQTLSSRFRLCMVVLGSLAVKPLTAQDTLFYASGAIQEIRLYSEDKTLAELIRYSGKTQKPTAREWYNRGQITRAERYEKWYKNGGVLFTSMTFYESGKLAEIGKCKWRKSVHFINEKCLPIGKWRVYYENGQLKETGCYNTARGRTGKWKSYHQNGHLAEKGKYNAIGECIGKWRFYDTKGRLRESYSYNTR